MHHFWSIVQVKKLATEKTAIKTADFKAIVGIPENDEMRGQTHIIQANSSRSRANRNARDKTIKNFAEIVSKGVLVEITPNEKRNRFGL